MLPVGRCELGALVGWLLVLVLAGFLTAIAVVCLAPRHTDDIPISLDAVGRALGRVRRAVTGGEGRLARVQRDLYERAIAELPRSRSGAIHLPGRVDALLSTAAA